MKRASRWLGVILGSMVLLSIGALIAFDAGGSNSAGERIQCPTNGDILPEGSICQVDDQYTNTLVSLGPQEAPCDRVQTPESGVEGSCRVLKSTDDSSGTSAWISFRSTSGPDVCIYVLPGGRQYGPWQCTDELLSEIDPS
jgi:hypothetical protein